MALPLVLLHPFPLDASFWDDAIPAIASEHEVLAPSLPGFGSSPRLSEPSIDAFADVVAERIGLLPAGRAVVLGVSMGGYVALSLAVRHPAAVGGLVLVDTRADGDDEAARSARSRDAAAIRAEGLEPFVDRLLPGLVGPEPMPGLMERLRAIGRRQRADGVVDALGAMAARPDRRPDLGQVAVPRLVMVGAQDERTPPAIARELAAGLGAPPPVVIDGAGHLLPVEAPDAFQAALRAFLARIGV